MQTHGFVWPWWWWWGGVGPHVHTPGAPVCVPTRPPSFISPPTPTHLVRRTAGGHVLSNVEAPQPAASAGACCTNTKASREIEDAQPLPMPPVRPETEWCTCGYVREGSSQ